MNFTLFLIVLLFALLIFLLFSEKNESFTNKDIYENTPYNHWRYGGRTIRCYKDYNDPRNPEVCRRIIGPDKEYSGRKCDDYGSRCPDAEKCFDAICKGSKKQFLENKCHLLEPPYSNKYNWEAGYEQASSQPDKALRHLRQFKVDSHILTDYDNYDYNELAERMNYDGKWFENGNTKLSMRRNLKCPGLIGWPPATNDDIRFTYAGKNSFHLNNIYNAWNTYLNSMTLMCDGEDSSGNIGKERCFPEKYITDSSGNYNASYMNACEYINEVFPKDTKKCNTTYSWDIKTGRYYRCKSRNDTCQKEHLPCHIANNQVCRADKCFTTMCKPKGISLPDEYKKYDYGTNYSNVLNKQFNDYRCEDFYNIEDMRKIVEQHNETKTPWEIARLCVRNDDKCRDVDGSKMTNRFDIQDASKRLDLDKSEYKSTIQRLRNHYKNKNIKKTLKCTNVKSTEDYSWPLKFEYGSVVY